MEFRSVGMPALRAAALLLGLLCGCRTVSADVPAAGPSSRPNIVFVLLDDAGFSDFGAYGSEIRTPNIDEIARSGVRFTNFHTASTCESSRTMLQSGVDHHRAGAGTLQVVIADNQRGKPGYEGYLADNVHSLGQLLHDAGYATYYSGKWNLGFGVERAPGARGWERYFALEQTGADNYEARIYAPLNREAVWWEDGRRAQLPPDFYSSRHYVDKLVQYIDEGRSRAAQRKPFMAMLAFQAVHSPLQAPRHYIDRYSQAYAAGWSAVRQQRYRRQVAMGLVPPGLEMPVAPKARDWQALGEDERRAQARKMAVFAGMLESADEELGRLREHLGKIGELDNTVFIVMSDNGADAYDLSRLNLPFRLWYRVHNDLGFEAMGGKGSYVHYGQDWAEVSNTPLRLFKGTSAEGGMRVPFIVQLPGRTRAGHITHEFAYATDFLPTVLDIAGVPLPGDDGKHLVPTGRSLLPLLQGEASAVHGPDEAIGFEGTGSQALFKGGFKLMRVGEPFEDGSWRLYDLARDWTESHDLAAERPELARAMLAEVEGYNERSGVVLPEAGYNPLLQLLKNNAPVLLVQLGGILAALLLAVLGLPAAAWFWWRRRSRSRA